MTPRTRTPKSQTRGAASAGKTRAFTAEEHNAMKDRVAELKADKTDGESNLLAKIAEMKGADRTMATRIHAIIKSSAPELTSRTWYGMPAYAKDDKVICFFKSGAKFKARYATFGFSDKANLDEGAMWATDFALKEWTPAVESRISALVKRAVS